MNVNFKIRYLDNNGKPHVRFTETMNEALIFIEAHRRKKLGTDFQLVRLKF